MHHSYCLASLFSFYLQLLRELREKEEKGFIVLVEEENSFITGRVGQRVRLRDPFMNGRPVLIEAMQIYKELERQKAIIRIYNVNLWNFC